MGSDAVRIRDLAARLRAGFPTEHGLDLMFEGCGIRVRTNEASLAARLRQYYAPFLSEFEQPAVEVEALEGPELELDLRLTVKPRRPAKKKVKEAYADLPDGRVVRKTRTGMTFLFGGDVHLAVGPCRANDNQIINFINNRYTEWLLRRGGLLFHAAGVARDGQGLALAGFSGMGKSTLALHLLRRGLDYVSNDRLIVEPEDGGLQMFGLPKLPRVNPGTILNNPNLARLLDEAQRARLEAMPRAELWELEEKHDVFLDTCFPESEYVLRRPMVGLVVLNWQQDGGAIEAQEVDLGSRPDLFEAFTKDVGLFWDPSGDHPEPTWADGDYARLLGGCPVVEIRGGVDFEAAAAFCAGLMERAADRAADQAPR